MSEEKKILYDPNYMELSEICRILEDVGYSLMSVITGYTNELSLLGENADSFDRIISFPCNYLKKHDAAFYKSDEPNSCNAFFGMDGSKDPIFSIVYDCVNNSYEDLNQFLNALPEPYFTMGNDDSAKFVSLKDVLNMSDLLQPEKLFLMLSRLVADWLLYSEYKTIIMTKPCGPASEKIKSWHTLKTAQFNITNEYDIEQRIRYDIFDAIEINELPLYQFIGVMLKSKDLNYASKIESDPDKAMLFFHIRNMVMNCEDESIVKRFETYPYNYDTHGTIDSYFDKNEIKIREAVMYAYCIIRLKNAFKDIDGTKACKLFAYFDILSFLPVARNDEFFGFIFELSYDLIDVPYELIFLNEYVIMFFFLGKTNVDPFSMESFTLKLISKLNHNYRFRLISEVSLNLKALSQKERFINGYAEASDKFGYQEMMNHEFMIDSICDDIIKGSKFRNFNYINSSIFAHPVNLVSCIEFGINTGGTAFDFEIIAWNNIYLEVYPPKAKWVEELMPEVISDKDGAIHELISFNKVITNMGFSYDIKIYGRIEAIIDNYFKSTIKSKRDAISQEPLFRLDNSYDPRLNAMLIIWLSKTNLFRALNAIDFISDAMKEESSFKLVSFIMNTSADVIGRMLD